MVSDLNLGAVGALLRVKPGLAVGDRHAVVNRDDLGCLADGGKVDEGEEG